jgi:drug/metabolite transporter (DMT)-like permease
VADIVSAQQARADVPRARRTRRGYALVLTGGLLFVVNAGVSKVALTAGVDAATLTALRAVGAAAVLGAALAVLRPRALRLSRREVPLLLAYGVGGVAMVQFLYFVAIDRLPVGVALLLEYTAPVWIALFARLVLREQVRRTVWAALGLSLAGLALVAQVWDSGALDLVGVLAGLGAGLAFATYFLAGEAAVARRDAISLSFWGFTFAAVFWSAVRPWWHGLDGMVGGDTSMLGALGELTVPVWALVLWIVVLGTVVPFAVETAALRYIPATTVGMVAMVEPVGAAVLAWLWFGEVLTPVQLAGGLVVLTGIVLAQTARPSAPGRPG